MKDSKPYEISKQVVMTAYKKVKANRGSCGVDGQDWKNLSKPERKLYKIWNRMSSGSYFPPPVKQSNTEIRRNRMLGIPQSVTGARKWWSIYT
jgi:retron-type reverse transcriptase